MSNIDFRGGADDMVTMTTTVTLEAVTRKLATLGDAILGNASLAEHSMTEPKTFLALHEHVVEIQRMVEALDAARSTGAA
jgi:hypothetical protein